ncbi:hypothetical protein [Syntrophus aciditrophicus]|uniref:hypothetical protein n=1 Tax=Syntrophus aciditrophicus TaxID=316277 RepID=UPI00059FE581|nr:hypothetical protein [Syntrophus aciditrophicus]
MKNGAGFRVSTGRFTEITRPYNDRKETLISNEALASITLFVAVSKPEEMETVKKLIVSILNRSQTRKFYQ